MTPEILKNGAGGAATLHAAVGIGSGGDGCKYGSSARLVADPCAFARSLMLTGPRIDDVSNRTATVVYFAECV